MRLGSKTKAVAAGVVLAAGGCNNGEMVTVANGTPVFPDSNLETPCAHVEGERKVVPEDRLLRPAGAGAVVEVLRFSPGQLGEPVVAGCGPNDPVYTLGAIGIAH